MKSVYVERVQKMTPTLFHHYWGPNFSGASSTDIYFLVFVDESVGCMFCSRFLSSTLTILLVKFLSETCKSSRQEIAAREIARAEK